MFQRRDIPVKVSGESPPAAPPRVCQQLTLTEDLVPWTQHGTFVPCSGPPTPGVVVKKVTFPLCILYHSPRRTI